MKPYGKVIKSPKHIRNINGYYCNFHSYCGCCDGPFIKKHKSMKAYERRLNKINLSIKDID